MRLSLPRPAPNSSTHVPTCLHGPFQVSLPCRYSWLRTFLRLHHVRKGWTLTLPSTPPFIHWKLPSHSMGSQCADVTPQATGRGLEPMLAPPGSHKCWERQVPFSAEHATRRDGRLRAAVGILTRPAVDAMHGPAGATSFESLGTAVPEARMAESPAQASWICDWFQSEHWLKLGGWLTAASQGVCGFGMSCYITVSDPVAFSWSGQPQAWALVWSVPNLCLRSCSPETEPKIGILRP